MGPDFKFLKKCRYVPDVFFFSVFLYIFTFCLAMMFRMFKTSRFFPSFVSTHKYIEIYSKLIFLESPKTRFLSNNVDKCYLESFSISYPYRKHFFLRKYF